MQPLSLLIAKQYGPKYLSLSFYLHIDIDECQFLDDACHKDAYCHNYDGNYDCTCVSGYYGNGSGCTGGFCNCARHYINWESSLHKWIIYFFQNKTMK